MLGGTDAIVEVGELSGTLGVAGVLDVVEPLEDPESPVAGAGDTIDRRRRAWRSWSRSTRRPTTSSDDDEPLWLVAGLELSLATPLENGFERCGRARP